MEREKASLGRAAHGYHDRLCHLHSVLSFTAQKRGNVQQSDNKQPCHPSVDDLHGRGSTAAVVPAVRDNLFHLHETPPSTRETNGTTAHHQPTCVVCAAAAVPGAARVAPHARQNGGGWAYRACLLFVLTVDSGCRAFFCPSSRPRRGSFAESYDLELQPSCSATRGLRTTEVKVWRREGARCVWEGRKLAHFGKVGEFWAQLTTYCCDL